MHNIGSIGLGTAAIGRPSYINIRQEGDSNPSFDLDAFRKAGIQVLDTAYENGIRYFDTAPGYGLAEEMLIDWVQSKADPTIEIASKWGYVYLANFEPDAATHELKDHTLKNLNRQWQQSKLLLPLLTTYQVHSASFESGVLENQSVLSRLAELKNLHNVRVGLTTSGSNHTDVLKKALDIEVDGQVLFDVFQVTYNILDQSLGSLASEISRQGKRLVIKEALANGRLFPSERYPHYASAYQQLIELSRKYQVGIDAIALRFCLQQIPVFKVLSGAGSVQHVHQNLGACEFELEEEDLEALSQFSVDPKMYWSERKQLNWN